MLFQYEGTFTFDAVTADLPTDLPKGQVIVRGVVSFDSNFVPLKPLTLRSLVGHRPTKRLVDRSLSQGRTAVSARSKSCCDYRPPP